MSQNPEVRFVRALEQVLKGLTITYTDQGSREAPEPFVAVTIGGVGDAVGYPVASIIPLGPQFRTERLGPQTLSRKTREVGVGIELHYEHADKEMGILNMSDILWTVVEAILAQPRLGGAESIEIGVVDYAYSFADELEGEENQIPDWGYKGVAIIPVYAQFKYS